MIRVAGHYAMRIPPVCGDSPRNEASTPVGLSAMDRDQGLNPRSYSIVWAFARFWRLDSRDRGGVGVGLELGLAFPGTTSRGSVR